MEAEVICSKCRRINYTGRPDPNIGLRGKDFQTYASNIVCKNKNCGRMLMMIMGFGVLEVKCHYCKEIHKYNTRQIKEKPSKHVVTDRAKWGR